MSFAPWLAGLLLFAPAQQGAPANPTGQGAAAPVAGPLFPAPVEGPDRNAILGWRGWTYLAGAPGKLVDRYPAGYEWGSLKAAPVAEAKADWRLKVVVLSSTTNEYRDPSGVLRADRHAMFNAQLANVKDSLARLVRWVSVASGGEVRLAPEITIESEEMRDATFGAQFASNYFGPRINGGGYEAEDKVYRGPYPSAIYILPGARTQDVGELVDVNGTSVGVVPIQRIGDQAVPGDLDQRLFAVLRDQARVRLERMGFQVTNTAGGTSGWVEASKVADVPTETRLARLKDVPSVALPGVEDAHPVLGPTSAATTVSLVADPDRGQVLHYAESGPERNGAFALPVRADGKPLSDLKDGSTLHFQIKTKSEDPIGLKLTDSTGAVRWIVLGAPAIPVVTSPDIAPLSASKAVVATVPLRHDGTWEPVAVSLSGSELKDVASVAVEATPGIFQMGRVLSEPIEFDLDDVKFDSESASGAAQALAPSATSANAEERALFAAKATASSPELVALLTDKSTLVRLNAADAYTRLKDDTAQPNLINDILDLDPTVAAYAMKALMHQGGQIALFTAQKTVKLGVTARVRETAARELGALKDAKYEADIDPLLTDRSRLNRLAAVQVFEMIPSKSAALRRIAFLAQDDPDIKMAVVRSADPKEETQMRSILWSAVNEPSDMLRAECDIKLIQSPDASFRAEGYKGVRDDSRVTRLAVLAFMAEHPDETHRNALRLAVTDRSAEVRAAALRGFAGLEKGAEPDEIANVMQDRDPDVQLALLELAKKRGLKLPEATRTLMSESPDKRVREALSAG